MKWGVGWCKGWRSIIWVTTVATVVRAGSYLMMRLEKLDGGASDGPLSRFLAPSGVKILVNGQDVTAQIGNPNGKDSGHHNAGAKPLGLKRWSHQLLGRRVRSTFSGVTDWTLGEHTIEFQETGGSGGKLKSYSTRFRPLARRRHQTITM